MYIYHTSCMYVYIYTHTHVYYMNASCSPKLNSAPEAPSATRRTLSAASGAAYKAPSQASTCRAWAVFCGRVSWFWDLRYVSKGLGRRIGGFGIGCWALQDSHSRLEQMANQSTTDPTQVAFDIVLAKRRKQPEARSDSQQRFNIPSKDQSLDSLDPLNLKPQHHKQTRQHPALNLGPQKKQTRPPAGAVHLLGASATAPGTAKFRLGA